MNNETGIDISKFTDRQLLQYKIGGLLYTPALNTTIIDKLINQEYKYLMSLCFCLEDSITDESLEEAENTLLNTLDTLSNYENIKLPLLFVRIRNPKHLKKIHYLLEKNEKVISGYVLPKFDLSNIDEYIRLIKEFNCKKDRKIYAMPILESNIVANLNNRIENLYKIKDKIDNIKNYILNVRVGGNDFSNLFGLRRNINQSIYDIGVIRDILVDIVNIFGREYIVSGAVWEYFGDNNNAEWKEGLKKELELDLLNGFIGKTSIHPSQLQIIFDSLKVDRNDYDDAIKIVNWCNDGFAVGKSVNGTRMNEVKCHKKWAEKIIILANIYGFK